MDTESSNAMPESSVQSDIQVSEKTTDVAAEGSNISVGDTTQTLPSYSTEESTSESERSIPVKKEVSLTEDCEGNVGLEENISNDTSNASVLILDKNMTEDCEGNVGLEENISNDPSNASVLILDKNMTEDCEGNVGLEENISNDPSNASVLILDKNITKAVIESLESADKKIEETASASRQNVVEKQISLKNMEQVFISALQEDGPNTESLPEDTNRITVPEIKVIDASDIEMDSDEETQNDKDAAVAEVDRKRKRDFQESEEDHMVEDDQEEEERASGCQLHDQDDVSLEERRATFYISSSELQQKGRTETTAPPEANAQTRTCEETYSCLASRKLHGSIITSSIFVAAVGVGLSNMARKGSAPEVFEMIGLSTTIISGIVGVLSLAYCCILTFLPSLSGNEPITDIENLMPMYTPMLPGQYVHESLNTETERAFRRQNNMSSPRTSAVAVRRKSRQEGKTEMVKMEIRSAMKSLGNALVKLETDEEKMEKQPLLKGSKKDDSSD